MNEAASLTDVRVAIVGLGLMGGSLAIALRGKCAGLIGVDVNDATLALARQMNIIDEASSDVGTDLSQADLIVLATPVRTILTQLDQLPGLHPGSPVVMDLGSTKTQVLAAMERLPARFDPIGGHPMCGKEHSSLANAEADIYQGAPFALVPLTRTSPRARSLAGQVVEAAGSNALWLDAETHDRWTAATSHLPYLIANILASITPLDAAPLVGPGFRSTSRLAVTPLHMMLDILLTNRKNLKAGIKRFQEQLELVDRGLDEGNLDGLRDMLTKGAHDYEALTERGGEG